ncbi:MAG: hypothetical protein ACYTKD_29970 [Planctomycetota bacterium]
MAKKNDDGKGQEPAGDDRPTRTRTQKKCYVVTQERVTLEDSEGKGVEKTVLAPAFEVADGSYEGAKRAIREDGKPGVKYHVIWVHPDPVTRTQRVIDELVTG